MTNARHKLNAAVIHGVMLFAGLIAAIAQSWTVFILIVVVLLATSVLAGDMRIKAKRR